MWSAACVSVQLTSLYQHDGSVKKCDTGLSYRIDGAAMSVTLNWNYSDKAIVNEFFGQIVKIMTEKTGRLRNILSLDKSKCLKNTSEFLVFEAQNELLAFRRLLQISGKFYSLLKVVPSVATLTHHLAQ
jgi:hypothetical protein